MNEFYKKYEEMITYVEKLDDKLTDKIEKIINKIKSISLEENLIKCLSTIYYVNNEKFESKLDQNPYIIGFTNGIYDLEKMEFRKGKPDDYISLSVGYMYDENAQYDELEEAIEKILPIDNVRHYVLKLLSYCLLGKNEIQKMFCFSGNKKYILNKNIRNYVLQFSRYYPSQDNGLQKMIRFSDKNKNNQNF